MGHGYLSWTLISQWTGMKKTYHAPLGASIEGQFLLTSAAATNSSASFAVSS